MKINGQKVSLQVIAVLPTGAIGQWEFTKKEDILHFGGRLQELLGEAHTEISSPNPAQAEIVRAAFMSEIRQAG